MTFTEAAVEVLRLVGKPLHYKQIAEIAIERNLLSHVGRTPEVTMSSRLATMVKKDRGDAPIVKVKPGVFGLREFPEQVLQAAQSESGHEYELPEEAAAAAETVDTSPAAKNGGRDSDPEAAPQALPGVDVFPEEDDDDELILGNKALQSGGEEGGSGGRSRRKRRRRRRGGKGEEGAEASSGGNGQEPTERAAPVRARGDAVRGDWERAPEDGELAGLELVEAIVTLLQKGPDRPRTCADLAAGLVQKGRLSGNASALAPTVAAAVLGDQARRGAAGSRLRFRLLGDAVSLVDWSLPNDAVRAEQDVVQAAERQREAVRRAFVRRLRELPASGLMQILAAWLNAEGVIALRGVKRPGASNNEFHLAGTLRRGAEERRLAVIVLRRGEPIDREKVIEVRGALHHYGNASAAWIVSTGSARSGAREEAAVEGMASCTLFDGSALSEAMERAGIGLVRAAVPVLSMDLDLLASLEPAERTERGDRPDPSGSGPSRGSRRDRGRRGGPSARPSSDRDGDDEVAGKDDGSEIGGDDEEANPPASKAEPPEPPTRVADEDVADSAGAEGASAFESPTAQIRIQLEGEARVGAEVPAAVVE